MSFLRKYDYRCPAGHIFEMTVDRYIEEMLCLCGLDAKVTWLKFPGTLAHSPARRFDPVTLFRSLMEVITFLEDRMRQLQRECSA